MFSRYRLLIRRLIGRRFLGVLFFISLTFCLGLGQGSSFSGYLSLGQVATAQTAETASASQRVQQGVDRYQNGDFQGAIQLWQGALADYQQQQDLANEAIVLENLARAYQAIGAMGEAIPYWEQATECYRQMQDEPQVGRMLIEQAQTYSRLGQQRQAIALLCGSTAGESTCVESSALQMARTANDPVGQAAALGSLGEAHRLLGDYILADAYLQAGLAVAQSGMTPLYSTSLLNSLGNTHASLAQVSYRRADYAKQAGDTLEVDRLRQEGIGHDKTALQYFQEGLRLSQTQPNQAGQLRLLLDSIPSDYRLGDRATATAKVQQVTTLLPQLPESQAKVYATIDLVRLLQPVAPNQPVSRVRCLNGNIQPQAEALLQQAIATANRIGDRRSQSFALGELGHLYECQTYYEQAIELTQQARLAAEQEPDSRYLWEWQTGRIMKQQAQMQSNPMQPDQMQAVIAAYEKSVATLETIRSDLLTANRDLQFDFRDTVDPVYRDLVELRLDLEQMAPQSEPQSDQKNISFALSTLDSLKLAELQNYFGNDCVIVPANQGSIDLTKVEAKAAVFNSVILDDRTAIIASFPDGQQQVSWLDISRERLDDEINQYRRELESFFKDYEPQQSRQVYDWLIRPFADRLEQTEVNTLVFVQDRILRTIPMAALHDGEQFLIQKYAIATTPSLTLTNPEPLDRQNLRALALGLTEGTTIDGRQFPPLDNVAQELIAVETQLPGSKPLLNQEFTRDRLQQELDQTAYPIIHIATHGEFGSEPQDTFLVTGDNQKLTITDLDTTIRTAAKGNAIELLSLTACQTATGDDRSALGLAGIAVQAGVSSAFASLWFIDDAATAQIVERFYAAVRDPSISKAEALRQAQLSVIEAGGTTAHPAYWAPFILIGNWL